MGEEENQQQAQQQKSAPKQQPPAQSNFGMGGQIPTYNQYGRAPQPQYGNQYGNYPGMQQGYPQMPRQQQYQGSWGRQQGPPIPFHPGGQQPQQNYGGYSNPYM